MIARPGRDRDIEGRTVRAIEAWRARSGLGLLYFVDEEGDRRASLAPEQTLETLTDADLSAVWERAVPLTPTERRIRDDDGRVWLIQGFGPVWAETGGAADAVGTRIRCLTHEIPPLRLEAVIPLVLDDAAALAAIDEHVASAGAG
ncbi:MAG: hypothetical protein MJB57_14760 [Gemmatimonadetes bacterium]|nr:hypothetical protein [Gemmatimonadota bacterium]